MHFYESIFREHTLYAIKALLPYNKNGLKDSRTMHMRVRIYRK